MEYFSENIKVSYILCKIKLIKEYKHNVKVVSDVRPHVLSDSDEYQTLRLSG
jgi:hypothetical protein